MESWYVVTLSQTDVSAMRNMSLQMSFQLLFMANHAPKNAGMFTDLETRFPAAFYFSPGAVRIAEILIASYSGKPCQAPKQSELCILVANTDLSRIPFSRD
jgi:hypothetical protein